MCFIMIRLFIFLICVPWFAFAKQYDFTPIPKDRLSQETKQELENVIEYYEDKKKEKPKKTEPTITIRHGTNLSADEDDSPVVKDSSTTEEAPADDTPKTINRPGLSISIASDKRTSKDTSDLTIQEAYKAASLGHIEAAVVLYRDTLRLQPDNISALYGLANLYQRQGVLKEAHHFYSRILTLEPDNQEALNNFLVLIGTESPENAIFELKRLEEIDPNLPLIPAQIAMMYARMDDVENTIKYFNKALLLNPSEDSYRYNLAVFLDKNNHHDEAEYYYVQLLKGKHRRTLSPKTYRQIQERLIYLGRQ